MKKVMLVLVLMTAFSIGSLLQAQVLINEVQYDPIGAGTDTKTEWIELTTPLVTMWTLPAGCFVTTTTVLVKHFPSTVLAAGEYLVLAAVVDSFHLNFPGIPAINWPDSSLGGGLSNTADMLVMLNSTGTVIDAVNWGTVSTLWPTWIKFSAYLWPGPGAIDAAQGHSIGRRPSALIPTWSDWADMASPTPGATNGGAVVYTPRTIYEIQHDGALTDSAVSVVAIVTSQNYVDFDGFMLAEATGPWHGIVVYSNANVVVGDSVIINGTVTEYNGLTELTASQVMVLGQANVPALTNVALADVKTGSPRPSPTKECW